MATGDLKGCMLLRGAKLSNTKTSRKGKFAFRLEGNGSSASHRAGRKWHKWAVAAAAKAHSEGQAPPSTPRPRIRPTSRPGAVELKFIPDPSP